MAQSEHLNELGAALAKAQGELQPAEKNAYNPFFKSKYANLESVWSVIKGPLSKNGLSVVQSLDFDDKGIQMNTILLHSSGQWISSKYPIRPVKNDPQGVASAITYARRYGINALVGVSDTEETGDEIDDDDDAEAAMNRRKAQNILIQPKVAPARILHTAKAGDPNESKQDYKIPEGQYKGRTIESFSHTELQTYIEGVNAKLADAPNKPIPGWWKDFLVEVEMRRIEGEQMNPHDPNFDQGA